MYSHPEGYKIVSQSSDARVVELRDTSQYTRWRGSVTHNSINLFLWHIVRKGNRWVREERHQSKVPQRNTARHLTMLLSLSCLSVFALISALSILTRLFEWSLVVATLMMPEYEHFCLWVSVDSGVGPLFVHSDTKCSPLVPIVIIKQPCCLI